MESLQILYIILAAVGVIFLGISIFTGGEADIDLDVGDVDFDVSDAEVGNDSVSLFSIRTLATFLLAFGLAGWSTFRGGAGITVQILSGFGAGLVVSFLYYLVMKGMYAMQGGSAISAIDLIGKTGTISIPTTDSGKGQVRIATNTGSTEYNCIEKSNKKLKLNELVNIAGVIDAGTLLVEKVK